MILNNPFYPKREALYLSHINCNCSYIHSNCSLNQDNLECLPDSDSFSCSCFFLLMLTILKANSGYWKETIMSFTKFGSKILKHCQGNEDDKIN